MKKVFAPSRDSWFVTEISGCRRPRDLKASDKTQSLTVSIIRSLAFLFCEDGPSFEKVLTGVMNHFRSIQRVTACPLRDSSEIPLAPGQTRFDFSNLAVRSSELSASQMRLNSMISHVDSFTARAFSATTREEPTWQSVNY